MSRLGLLREPGQRSGFATRIAVIPERYGSVMSPCASIRLHAFAERFPADVRYLIPEELEAFSPHVVIWNRGAVTEAEHFECIADAGRRGARLIYDLDDNLLAMEEHPEREAYAGIIAAVRRSISLADVTWCSTPLLADAIEAEGGAVEWMPNALDNVLWKAADPNQAEMTGAGKLRLLYMGTRTHDEDFRLLDQALEIAWSQREGGFSLTLIGVNANVSRPRPWLSVESPPSHVGASYPAFVHWFSQSRGFHVGLAPLLDSTFNRCKSSIKVLDYAQLGLVTVASNVAAYRDDAMDDRILVDNTPQDWARCITQLVDQALPLEALTMNARQRVSAAAFDVAVARRWSSCVDWSAG